MFKNLISICILAFMCAFSVNELFGQQEETSHKIVIIEKTVDENGDIVEKKVVKEGKEAEAYIKEMEAGEEEGKIKKEATKIVRQESYKIKTKEGSGETKVLEWDGEGEMPDDIKAILEKEGVDYEEVLKEVESEKAKSKKRVKIIKKDGNGHEDIQEMEFEGDDLPDDVKKILEEEGIDLNELKQGEDGGKQIRIIKKEKTTSQKKKINSKKGQLGVNIGNDPMGVKIIAVLPKSAAAEAGLKVGDVVTQVNEVKVGKIEALVGEIGQYAAGDKVNIEFVRNGKEDSREVVLKERIEAFKFKTWEEVMNHGKESKGTIKEIEIEKEVIIEKK